MRIGYNHFAGRNLDRLAALSDGIFAVAMTLLVLDLHIPVLDAIHAKDLSTTPFLWTGEGIEKEWILLSKLGEVALHFLPYLMSFLTLGIFWVGQQTQLNYFARGDRYISWIHLGFLLTVSLLPFSTALLAAFITYRVALVIYWLNLALLGLVLFCSWRYAQKAGLLKEEVTPDMVSATERRILVFQALYFACLLPGVFNTYISIVFIILTQLDSALAPRLGWLYRI